MRRSVVGLAVLVLMSVGAYAVFAGGESSSSCSSPAQASAAKSSCSSDQSAASCEVAGGKIAGRFVKDEYVTCCDKCAQKLKRNPRHYLKA